MKLALRYIPTEVWVDVFRYPWIPRWKLGKIVDRFKNRKFTKFLQFFLHDWGKRTLDMIYLNKQAWIPRTPLPANIKYFDRIIISHFDSQMLDFLRRINTLFINDAGVNLVFDYGRTEDLAHLRTVLDHLCPLLHGIHSLAFNQWAISFMKRYFAPKLAQIKVLGVELVLPTPAIINFCMDWLTAEERDPTEPRLLEVRADSRYFQQVSMAIQKQFLSAKRPCTFAFNLSYCRDGDPIADFHLENNRGEQLHGQYKNPWIFQILRHQPNADTALQEWIQKTNEKCSKSSVIELPYWLTIGQIDVNVGAIEVDFADGEEEANQSSTSG